MKLLIFMVAFLAAAPASAFILNQQSTLQRQHQSLTTGSSALNLFGNKKEGDAKAPGMMDQLAMFKKAQEIATKKKQLDEELAKGSWEVESADGNVKAVFKCLPSLNPMDPNPDYEAASIKFDQAWFDSASPEDISKAVKETVIKGIEVTTQAVAEKYSSLQAMAFGQ
ncbi:hypothetical protein MPSEU_000476400 [Mayamaea pseudoterrestris]|nr:hypothetical protein MPSEU_000476400 [Mayamaea pseudoterrestris]